MIDRAVNEPEYEHAYQHLSRSIGSIDANGVKDFDFRAEFSGFVFALADVFFGTLNKRSAADSSALVSEALNVTVEFGNPPRRWSSVSLRAVFQACALRRVRYWLCKERGVDYPNAAIEREIQHSTFLNLRCYYSIHSHVARVWDSREYDGGLMLSRMVDSLLEKFGVDLEPYDVADELRFLYGARPQPAPDPSPRVLDEYFTERSVSRRIE